jgi:hypothetical protein
MTQAETRPTERRRWTEREEMILVAYSATFGRNWKRYEEFLPGRTAKQIGVHYDEMIEREVYGKVHKKPVKDSRKAKEVQKEAEEDEDWMNF